MQNTTGLVPVPQELVRAMLAYLNAELHRLGKDITHVSNMIAGLVGAATPPVEPGTKD